MQLIDMAKFTKEECEAHERLALQVSINFKYFSILSVFALLPPLRLPKCFCPVLLQEAKQASDTLLSQVKAQHHKEYDALALELSVCARFTMCGLVTPGRTILYVMGWLTLVDGKVNDSPTPPRSIRGSFGTGPSILIL